MKKKALELISASAGSGKTYTLTGRLADAISADGVRPEAVLATTFTNKAAAELTERVRLRLLKQGLPDDAQRILDGYIGTVNSVCGTIVRDFAFEAGLPPVQTVLPDGEDQAIYNRAVSAVIDLAAPDIEPAAERLQIADWQNVVKRISDAARTNNISPSKLAAFAERSWKGYQKLLTDPVRSGKTLDDKLTDAMEKTLKKINLELDKTDKTKNAVYEIRQLLKLKKTAENFTWADWARISKLSPGQQSQELFEPVLTTASSFLKHPRLHSDIEIFIQKVFACAADGMQAFAKFKAQYGLIDFVDQERLCHDLLSRSDVQKSLKSRLDLVLVDEFQDTSPLQLAVFLKLMDLVGRAIWVGDQKQAIYGFRGTDPALMDAVIEALVPEPEILKDSYRSRPGLVEFTSAVFARAFEPVGIPPKRVGLNAMRKDRKEFNAPLHIWRLMGSNIPLRAQALAADISGMLANPTGWQVEDPASKALRPVRAGDIAILCRYNDHCADIADAIESFGVRATIPRSGLLATPEGVYGYACLRYLVDSSDTVAAAEIIHFTSDASKPLAWFEKFQIQSADSKPWQGHPVIDALDKVRDSLIALTPAEAFHLALKTGGAHEQALGWGDCATRLANIEALHSLASAYEEHCLVQQSAATAAGLVLYLSDLAGGDDAQAEGVSDNAVQVLTYHGAKGLEWPVVILYDLEATERANLFNVHVIPSAKAFDVKDPLAGRWIRYWPWPFDKQKKNLGLDSKAEESAAQKELTQRERKEMIRVLYVGMTRARDYLIFAVNEKNRADWLESMEDTSGEAVMTLPEDQFVEVKDGKKTKKVVVTKDRVETVQVGKKTFKFSLHFAKPAEPTVKKSKAEVFLPATGKSKKQFPPARIIPSRPDVFSDASFSIKETVQLGERLKLSSKADWQMLGNAFHGFFAADDHAMPKAQRLAIAARLLAGWEVDCLKLQDLLTASDRLHAFIKNRYGEKITMHREWPMNIRIDNRKASGWIDLLLETPKGYVILDHKIFHETMGQVENKVLDFAPQLTLYQQAVEEATGAKVSEIVLHMPVHGVALIESVR